MAEYCCCDTDSCNGATTITTTKFEKKNQCLYDCEDDNLKLPDSRHSYKGLCEILNEYKIETEDLKECLWKFQLRFHSVQYSAQICITLCSYFFASFLMLIEPLEVITNQGIWEVYGDKMDDKLIGLIISVDLQVILPRQHSPNRNTIAVPLLIISTKNNDVMNHPGK
ncbi:unnamed protein product [Onchocerca flexuosa]|uniref:Activin_recp domain-containing protein n=1 Tax=Onchocerca flexuosa TaxID=387005 RepID=A0A183H3B0_9BILA|nr:unnamed protein product [Onchocerca flexuosa]